MKRRSDVCDRVSCEIRKAFSVFFRLLLLFAIVPLLELWLLVEMTKRTSLLWTISLVILTGMLGTILVRWQGLKAWQQIQQQLAEGKSPSTAIVSGVLVLVAGAFLLTPGIITDTAGFLLLIPPVRNLVARWLQKRMVTRVVGSVSKNGSVWFSSFSTSFDSSPQPPFNEPLDRPTVRVIDPNEPKLE